MLDQKQPVPGRAVLDDDGRILAGCDSLELSEINLARTVFGMLLPDYIAQKRSQNNHALRRASR
jgi:hypothetical protein